MFNTSSVGGVIAGVFVLILVFLLISNADKTVKVISTIGQNALAGVTVLQGR